MAASMAMRSDRSAPVPGTAGVMSRECRTRLDARNTRIADSAAMIEWLRVFALDNAPYYEHVWQ